MHILVCIPCLLTGGTEIQTLSLLKALIASGYEVTTICYFEHTAEMVNRYQRAGSEVVCFSSDGKRPHNTWQTIRFLYKGFKQQLRKEKYDIAHVQYMAPGAIPILLLRLLGIKTIIATAHTAADIYPSLKLLHFIQRYILTAFICITLKAEESFFRTSQLYSPDLMLKKRGNHFTIYNNLPDYIQIAQKPRQFCEVITIGVVSRLEHIKGMDLVVPTFKEIHKKYPTIKLLVVGDGSLRESMERQITADALIDCVAFMGRLPQEQLQDFYDQIDILLVPSRSEGFGLTALEGMARGCIVVASDVGGLSEIMQGETSGLLCPVGDSMEIAKRVCLLLEQKSQLSNLSSGGREKASLFSTNIYQMQYSNLYHRILK